jgi:hypothetical protein
LPVPPNLGGNVIAQRRPVVKPVDAHSIKVKTLKAQDGGVLAARAPGRTRRTGAAAADASLTTPVLA